MLLFLLGCFACCLSGWFVWLQTYLYDVCDCALYDAVVEVGFLRKNKLCRFGLKAYFSFISANIS